MSFDFIMTLYSKIRNGEYEIVLINKSFFFIFYHIKWRKYVTTCFTKRVILSIFPQKWYCMWLFLTNAITFTIYTINIDKDLRSYNLHSPCLKTALHEGMQSSIFLLQWSHIRHNRWTKSDKASDVQLFEAINYKIRHYNFMA